MKIKNIILSTIVMIVVTALSVAMMLYLYIRCGNPNHHYLHCLIMIAVVQFPVALIHRLYMKNKQKNTSK